MHCIFVFKGLNTLSGWNSSDDVDPMMNEAPPLCLVGLKLFCNEYYLINMSIKINQEKCLCYSDAKSIYFRELHGNTYRYNMHFFL